MAPGLTYKIKQDGCVDHGNKQITVKTWTENNSLRNVFVLCISRIKDVNVTMAKDILLD